ncbi:MAG TPA: hypothetical protein VGL81_21420 [Polyangiaceae bacterium]|jgi:hypothetical protein
MLLPLLTIEQFRERVREAEALLRVARQHARDAHDDLSKSDHANARIQSICREVESLFPGLHDPSAPDPALQETIAALHAELPAAVAARLAEEEAAADGEGEEEDAEEEREEEEEDDEEEGEEEDAGEEQGEEDDEEEEEWDVDYAKLATAIENETLMSAFPEPGRTAFKRAARYLIESHARQELFSRVIAGFEQVAELTQLNVEETRKKLAMALTLEELASQRKG